MRTLRSTGSLAALLWIACCSTAFAQMTFVQIAREFGGGLMWLDPDVRPGLAEDGTVAFAGSHDYAIFDATRIFAGDGGALTSLDLSAAALSDPFSAEINDAGQIVIVATHTGAVDSYRGVYTTTTASGTFSTLYEGLQGVDPTSTPVGYNAALSANGTIAFSSVRNGNGAIYRAAFGSSPSVLRQASGDFYNTMRLDVNDAGQVAVQMEYFDPTAGLSRGILLFDAPAQTLSNINSALDRLSVGSQPQPAINASGQVAFATGSTLTMIFYDPPGVFGTVLETVTVDPGVYVVNPAPWGTPKHPTQIAAATDGYSSFGQVDINDLGEVVFEASANGESGIFKGHDPVADKVVATGDVLGEELFSVVRLGKINNGGSISLLTSDFNSTDRQIWRIDGVFAPPPPPPPPPPPRPRDVFLAFWLRLLHLIFGR